MGEARRRLARRRQKPKGGRREGIRSQGAEPALVALAAALDRATGGEGQGLGANADRRVHPREIGREGTRARAAGQPAHATAPVVFRFDWFAAIGATGGGVCRRLGRRERETASTR